MCTWASTDDHQVYFSSLKLPSFLSSRSFYPTAYWTFLVDVAQELKFNLPTVDLIMFAFSCTSSHTEYSSGHRHQFLSVFHFIHLVTLPCGGYLVSIYWKLLSLSCCPFFSSDFFPFWNNYNFFLTCLPPFCGTDLLLCFTKEWFLLCENLI